MIAPRDVGGAEVAFPEGIAVFEELGYADASAAWHVANSAALSDAVAVVNDCFVELLRMDDKIDHPDLVGLDPFNRVAGEVQLLALEHADPEWPETDSSRDAGRSAGGMPVTRVLGGKDDIAGADACQVHWTSDRARTVRRLLGHAV